MAQPGYKCSELHGRARACRDALTGILDLVHCSERFDYTNNQISTSGLPQARQDADSYTKS